MLDVLALGVAHDWFFLRLEIHDFLKGRIAIGDAERIPFKKCVQIHALLDKVDDEKATHMAEVSKQIERSRQGVR